MNENDVVVVDEVAGELQAEIIRGLLEAQGIPTWLSQEGVGRVYGLGVGVLGRVQILVPSPYSEQARQVLDDYMAGKFEGTSYESPEDPTESIEY
jgi:hypothetical protein